jgi:hypothetical protein
VGLYGSPLTKIRRRRPAKDRHHNAVKNALIKDVWTIVFDPYPIKYQEVKLLADLAGGKTISAEKEEKQIVVEIKSFWW